jgi:hypothetical protein
MKKDNVLSIKNPEAVAGQDHQNLLINRHL